MPFFRSHFTPALLLFVSVIFVPGSIFAQTSNASPFFLSSANATVNITQDEKAEAPIADRDPEFAKAFNSLDETLNVDPEEKLASELLLRNRLVTAALIGGMFLGWMGVLFAYLRLDHATRGFYSGRLQTLAAVISIAILVVGYILWSQVLF